MDLPIDYPSATRQERRAARLAYIQEQGGKCAHCGDPLSGNPHPDIMNTPLDMRLFPKGFLDWPVHLHHDHNTGKTIGAVHARCNGVLWQHHGE